MKARGGGDWPENVNEALDVAVNKLQWTKAPMPGGSCSWSAMRRRTWITVQDTKYPVTLSVAKQKDIIVNAVLAGDARDTERVWRDIAQNGNGRFIPIPQDGGQVVIIETPYDEEIIILQREINGTVIPYGPRAIQKRTGTRPGNCPKSPPPRPRRPRRWRAPQQALERNVRSRHGWWRSRRRVSTGRSSFSAIKDEDLPDNLRAMKPEQRAEEVNKQMSQRKALNEKLAALVAKRDKDVADQRSKAPPKASSSSRPRGGGYAEGADQAVSSSRPDFLDGSSL